MVRVLRIEDLIIDIISLNSPSCSICVISAIDCEYWCINIDIQMIFELV